MKSVELFYMIKKSQIVVLVAVLLIFGGIYCFSYFKNFKNSPKAYEVVGNTWAWKETVVNGEKTVNSNFGKNYLIHFRDGKLKDTDGCNSFEISYKLNLNHLSFNENKDLPMTQLGCGQTATSDKAFFKFFDSTSLKFSLDDELVLESPDKNTLVYFQTLNIANFNECREAGYPVGKTKPLSCHTPLGDVFFEEQREVEEITLPPHSPTKGEDKPVIVDDGDMAPKCYVGGCSNQLCTDKADGAAYSTCEYRAEYACYKTAICERQVTGECGWTETKELNACLQAN